MILIVLPDIPSEDKLLAQARRGDKLAVMQIYESYFSPVYHYVRLRVDDVMVADDITSEVFLKLISSLTGKNPPKKSLRGWLFKVARNVIYDYYGQSKRAPTIGLDEWISAPEEEQPEIQFLHTIDVEQLKRAIKQLKPEQQEVLLLRFGQTLNLQDTADIMGKSVSAIKSLQFRATETLRHLLNGVERGGSNV